MPKITFVKEKLEIEVPEGTDLRTAARRVGIELYQGPDRYLNCRGLGLCGTCRVLVKKGMENLSPKGFKEKFRLALSFAPIGQEAEMRLACQALVRGDCTIESQPAFNYSGDNFWARPYPNK
jgi:ferredoxin